MLRGALGLVLSISRVCPLPAPLYHMKSLHKAPTRHRRLTLDFSRTLNQSKLLLLISDHAGSVLLQQQQMRCDIILPTDSRLTSELNLKLATDQRMKNPILYFYT